jgi:hypothetical protein
MKLCLMVPVSVVPSTNAKVSHARKESKLVNHWWWHDKFAAI